MPARPFPCIRQSVIALIAVLTAALGSAGCGPSSVTVNVRGVAPMNVNDKDESTPVSVRFYQLKRAEKFRAADFDQLWTDAPAVLGDDRIGDPALHTVYPGNRVDPPVKVTITPIEDATAFIGVMALYRKGDATDSRRLVLTVDEADGKLIELSGFAVALETTAASPAPANAAPASATPAK